MNISPQDLGPFFFEQLARLRRREPEGWTEMESGWAADEGEPDTPQAVRTDGAIPSLSGWSGLGAPRPEVRASAPVRERDVDAGTQVAKLLLAVFSLIVIYLVTGIFFFPLTLFVVVLMVQSFASRGVSRPGDVPGARFSAGVPVPPRPAAPAVRMDAAVTTGDIARLRKQTDDPLQQQYLALVVMAIQLPPPADPSARRHVREALQALGRAAGSLPPHTSEQLPGDPAALQAESARLAVEARSEPDPIVAGSRERQAAALLRQAETLQSIVAMLRRNQALRGEIGGQIDALRASLAAFRMVGEQNIQELSILAENIQRVAGEVNSITLAHAELDGFLGARPAGTPPAAPEASESDHGHLSAGSGA